ncbi:glycosyltransferase involved in cell wall biosynthesis [Flavobacterium sp. 9]|uniref:glycosyltransferase n=1 Tax=Flavobacterium sp. 9 TaxID=2035198 RepID=UPI000C193E2C|nr:glycosyltransferase [Flavobacterium sp. 9]PIF31353.1 glycosyltransferase involved in cell wall biosynthesis [Flavobacterium sp. 9]
MRVVQIIDSLEIGGAERMAVNYANALSEKIEFSGIISTRKEGPLLNQIDRNVAYLFLNKKNKIDIKAVFRLRKYIRQNKVDFIHAHSSSFFIAVLVKLTFPKIKIIWHDHYGSRAKESKKENRVLIFMSLFFYSIFVVNLQLKEWSEKNMLCKRILFIPNFTLDRNELQRTTILKGTEGKRIVFLANLKKPKNHISILKAFLNLKLHELDWSLHLIGKDYFDSYSDELKKIMKSNSLEEYIHIYGERSDVKNILSQVSIGILASTEEGFPVTLLEYGLAELAVVCTNVGYCSSLIEEGMTGLLFNPYSENEIESQLMRLVDDNNLRKKLGINFKQSVLENYSEEMVIKKLILAYKE